MRLLPFAAAAADAGLTLKCQLTSSMPSRGTEIVEGRWRRPTGRCGSSPVGSVPCGCCTSLLHVVGHFDASVSIALGRLADVRSSHEATPANVVKLSAVAGRDLYQYSRSNISSGNKSMTS